jgi:hypothetical protein
LKFADRVARRLRRALSQPLSRATIRRQADRR